MNKMVVNIGQHYFDNHKSKYFSHFCNYDSAADVIGHDHISQKDYKIETGRAILQGVEIRLELAGMDKK